MSINLYKFFFFLCCIFLNQIAQAQYSLESSYVNSHTGETVNLLLKKDFKNGKFTIYGGVKYLFSRQFPPRNTDGVGKIFYPRNVLQSLGPVLGIQRNFAFNPHVRGLAFYQTQLTNTPLRSFGFGGLSISDDKVTALEHLFGVGLQARLTERFSFIIRGGGNVIFTHAPNRINESGGLGKLKAGFRNADASGVFTIGACVALHKSE